MRLLFKSGPPRKIERSSVPVFDMVCWLFYCCAFSFD